MCDWFRFVYMTLSYVPDRVESPFGHVVV